MDNKEETLISHIEALRTVLIKCLQALGIMLVPTFFLSPYCMRAIIKIMVADNNISLNFFQPMEVFIIELKIAAVLDLLVCFPYMAKKIWEFVLPGLLEHERCFIKSVVLSSSALFIMGALFCLFFILPLIVNFGISFATEEITAMFGISNMIAIALWLSVVFGLAFQFPLITYSLIRSNIASYEGIKAKRPYIFVTILILAALITPPDIISQIMLALPTYLLFELGLYCAKKAK